MTPESIPAEQVTAALHFLGITPDDLVIAHVTPHEIRVKQVVRDARGNALPDLSDPSQVAMATTVHPIDYTVGLDKTAILQPIDTGKDGHA